MRIRNAEDHAALKRRTGEAPLPRKTGRGNGLFPMNVDPIQSSWPKSVGFAKPQAAFTSYA